MSMTRSGSVAEGRRRAHGINLGALYRNVLNYKWNEVYGDHTIPDRNLLRDWAFRILGHTPPEPVMLKKHAIMWRQINRWRAMHGLGPLAPTWQSLDERWESVSDENFRLVAYKIRRPDGSTETLPVCER